MKIKKNDQVLVITGKDAGKKAKVLTAMPKSNKIVVDGVNVQKRHTKARSANQTSEIKMQSGPIDASNVLVVCPACDKATRVAYKIEGDKKVRVCKKCGAILDVSEAKEVKKAVKATEKKATAKKTTTKKAETSTEEAPAKKTTTKKATATSTAKKTATKKATTKKADETAEPKAE